MKTDLNDLSLITLIRESSAPLSPVETKQATRNESLSGIRAVLFDIYGTLLISASGDIGTVREDSDAGAAVAALRESGLIGRNDLIEADVDRLLEETIRARHANAREQGIEFPEVDITAIWREAIQRLGLPLAGEPGLKRIAVMHECRTNPVWPMPGMEDTLDRLRASGLRLGIVSNAQFYTPLTIEALTGRSTEDLGFDPALCAWSWRLGEAKPSTRLFEAILNELEQRFAITPDETLYVGNDMLKDIWPASRCGCRTALFAGDGRSLRLRENDPRAAGARPDLVINDLRQIPVRLC